MSRLVLLALFQMILTSWTQCNGVNLPKWVLSVDSCPDPYNISQWMQASTFLNCLHGLASDDSDKQERVYQCMPSSFLNETVEFCGRSVPIEAGHCPVYTYQYGANIQPSYFNCSSFSSGCPNKTFYSKEVFKHPACLIIISSLKCFEAQKNCSYEYTSSTYHTKKDEGTTMGTHPTLISSSNETANSGSVDSPGSGSNETANSGSVDSTGSGNTVTAIVVVLGIICTVLFITVLVLYVRLKPKRLNLFKVRKRNKRTSTSKEKENLIEMNDIQSKIPKEAFPNGLHALDNLQIDTNLDTDKEGAVPKKLPHGNSMPNGKTQQTDIEETSPKKLPGEHCGKTQQTDIEDTSPKKLPGEHCGSSMSEDPDENVLLFNSFYFQLAEKIQKDAKIMKTLKFLLNDNAFQCKDKDGLELLLHWHRRFDFFFNFCHLQELLTKCKADELVRDCEKFAKEHLSSMKLFYFSRKYEDDGREILILHTAFNIHDKTTRDKMEKIRNTLAVRLRKNIGDIILEGIEEGSLIFIFSLSELNTKDISKDFFERLQTLGVFMVETKEYTMESDPGVKKTWTRPLPSSDSPCNLGDFHPQANDKEGNLPMMSSRSSPPRERLALSGSVLSDDSEMMEGLDDVDFVVSYPRLREAVDKAGKEKNIMPLIKEDLKKGDIVIEEKKHQVKWILTPEEIERKLRRQEQNRRAAKKCRKKKKDSEATILKAYNSEKDKNLNLSVEVEELIRETEKLEEFRNLPMMSFRSSPPRERLALSGSVLSDDSEMMEGMDDVDFRKAVYKARKEKNFMSLIKEDLWLSIPTRGNKEGQGDIVIEENKHQVKRILTPEELERKLRRKEQNRRAAKKCRKKKKDSEVTILKAYNSEKDKNLNLSVEVEELKRETKKLKEYWRDQMSKCSLIQNQSLFVPILPDNAHLQLCNAPISPFDTGMSSATESATPNPTTPHTPGQTFSFSPLPFSSYTDNEEIYIGKKDKCPTHTDFSRFTQPNLIDCFDSELENIDITPFASFNNSPDRCVSVPGHWST